LTLVDIAHALGDELLAEGLCHDGTMRCLIDVRRILEPHVDHVIANGKALAASSIAVALITAARARTERENETTPTDRGQHRVYLEERTTTQQRDSLRGSA